MDAIDSYAERPDQVVYLDLSAVFGPSAAPEGLFTVKADVAEVLSGALSGWPDARIVLISTPGGAKGLLEAMRDLGALASRRLDSAFEDLAVKVPFGRINALMKPEEYAGLDKTAVVSRHVDWLRPRCWIAVDVDRAGWPEATARQHLVLADAATGLLTPATLDRLLTVLEGNFGPPVLSGGASAPTAPDAWRVGHEELHKLESVTVHRTPGGVGYVLFAELDEPAKGRCWRYAAKRRGLLRLPSGQDAVFFADYRLWIETLGGACPEE